MSDIEQPIPAGDLSQALGKLRELGVPYDRLYRNQFPDDSRGIHIYINNGFDCNVAYYTPDMGTLMLLDGGKGRIDGTREEERKEHPMPYVSAPRRENPWKMLTSIGGYTVWINKTDDIPVYLVSHETPGPDDGGYYRLSAALAQKGL